MKRKLRRLFLAVPVVATTLALPQETESAQGVQLAQFQQPPKTAQFQQPPKTAQFQQPPRTAMMRGGPPKAARAPGASACSLCWTCGGAWPEFSGWIPVQPGPAPDQQPSERGEFCAGDLAPNPNDTFPYLCCR
jgi:hypothetical protein